MISFTDEDQRQVNEIQAALTQTLLRANELKVESALAVFALVRCARILLDQYPEHTRKPLAAVCAQFLEHAPNTDESGIILTH